MQRSFFGIKVFVENEFDNNSILYVVGFCPDYLI